MDAEVSTAEFDNDAVKVDGQDFSVVNMAALRMNREEALTNFRLFNSS